MPLTRSSRIGVLAGTAGLLAVGLVPAPAAADDVSCRASLGAVRVDNLTVPQNATCTLTGTIVSGNITVQSGARLTATGVRVDGNVQAENASAVVVRASSRIEGNVQVKQGGSASVADSVIDGDIQYDDNRRRVVADRNRVGGNIQIFGNRGGVGVNGNRVDGDLQCKANVPPPTGGGNIVSGNIEDQCRNLSPTTTPPAKPNPTPKPGPVLQPVAKPKTAKPKVGVAVKAVKKRSKLFVNVNPDKGRGFWTFKVQRKQNGSWRTYAKSWKTLGPKEVRTVNFQRGRYRVVVQPKYGYRGATSRSVFLRK